MNNEFQDTTTHNTFLWIKIKDLIKSITKNSDDYDEKYLKIKFNSELLLNKMIEIRNATIVLRVVFHKKIAGFS